MGIPGSLARQYRVVAGAIWLITTCGLPGSLCRDYGARHLRAMKGTKVWCGRRRPRVDDFGQVDDMLCREPVSSGHTS